MKRQVDLYHSALSQVELLIMVSVLAILSGIGLSTMGGGQLSWTKAVKIEQDLKTLNSAVSAYLAFGGDLSRATTAGEVIAKLKTTVSEEQQRRTPGLSGAFLDREVDVVMQTQEEAGSANPRIHWNSDGKRFELVESGEPGIKALVIKSAGFADTTPDTEERKSGLKYSATGTWIWDYIEVAPTFAGDPSSFATVNPGDSTPSTPPTPVGGMLPPVNKPTLQEPVFSIPGGIYPAFDYKLPLYLHDPNPPGASRIFYSVNYGAWTEYPSGFEILVSPESSIKAQAIPSEAEVWNASPTVDERYYASPARLLPPTIQFSDDYFLTDKTTTIDNISVTLTDQNHPGTSALYYQLIPVPGGGGSSSPFALYTGSFAVASSTYPDGFGVRSYAGALISGYDDSRVSSRFATSKTGLFGGHLDLDTSTKVASVGSGQTDAHTHAITDKYGISAIDFFAIPDSKQIEITEAISNRQQKFKLTIVNANLSPGMSVVIDFEENGISETQDMSVVDYDDTEIKDLNVFTFEGAPSSAVLKGLRIVMSQDVLYGAGVIPTVTGDVVSNVLGKEGEWRNGALTLQAVAVNTDGTEAFFADSSLSNGAHGAAKTGLLWEAALFWHWGGDSYDDAKNTYVPGHYNSVRLYIENK